MQLSHRLSALKASSTSLAFSTDEPVPNWLITAQVIYFIAVSLWAIQRGVVPDTWFLTFCLFIGLAWFASLRGFLVAMLPLLALLMCYEQLRTISDKISPYSVHVTDLIWLEKTIFGGHIPSVYLQTALPPESHTGAALWAVCNVIYGSHFVTPILLAFILWTKDKRSYWHFIGGLIAMSYAAFFGYLLFPAAPPWWAHHFGYISDQLVSPVDEKLLALISNPVAAMPSLHGGYALYCGYAIAERWPKMRAAAVVLPAVMCFSTVYLAHHYVIDQLAGWLLAAMTIFIARLIPTTSVASIRTSTPIQQTES